MGKSGDEGPGGDSEEINERLVCRLVYMILFYTFLIREYRGFLKYFTDFKRIGQ